MRSMWTGAISFGLVNIPIKLYSASQSHSLNLDMLHSKDLSPIRYPVFLLPPYHLPCSGKSCNPS